MAKSDFDINNEEYDVVYDEDQKKGLFSRGRKDSKKKNSEPAIKFSKLDNGMLYNVNDNNSESVSKDFPDMNNDYNNVVFEEKTNLSFRDKIRDYISTINMTALIAIGGFVFAIFILVMALVLSVVRENNSYTSDIMVPSIVYMGETSSVSVNSRYTGKKIPKKNVANTITNFDVKSKKVISVTDAEVKGNEVFNAIVPIQEGRSKIEVTSKLNNKIIGSVEKEVVVCPSFDSSLLLGKQISVVKGLVYDPKIDFGEKECGKGVKYESSNEEIATVDENGAVIGVEVGSAIITIKKGSKSASFNVNVTERYIGLESFNAIPSSLQLSQGEKTRIKIDYLPINATSFNTVFKSNDESVVKVSDGGLVEALKEGTTTIRVSPPSAYFEKEVKVIVTKANTEGDFATAMTVDKENITLVEGKSEKVTATLTPEGISNKVITWKSSNATVVTVDSNGVIYGKSSGTADVTATTKNGISKTVKVTVVKMEEPVIKVSDGILTNVWHTRPYVINFSSSENGVIFYYGKSENDMNSTGKQIVINKDETTTYYVKACTRTCMETCTDKKDKRGNIVKDDDGEPIKVCTSKCSKKPTVCSNSVSYISKLDTTKPQAVTVAGIERTPVKKDDVQIALKDATSLIQKWCVTNKNSFSTCKWNTIQTNANPVVNYTATKNGTYYVFAKDTAGNISDSLSFQITNIE